MIKERIFKLMDFTYDGHFELVDFDGVYVKYDGKTAIIGSKDKATLSRGYFLFAKELKKGNTSFEIKQNPHFDTCGPMLCLSAGCVMTVDAVKNYIDNIAALGLNMLMLYTEMNYELKEYPLFGYLRGRYTWDELREIDRYALEMGVEVIPCIQTLGHLERFLKWGAHADIKDNASVLLIGEEKTYKFIEAEIDAMRSCFTSKRIHIGMDEAFGFGFGQYFIKNGYRDRFDLFNEHLARVCDIAKKYDFKPMIWCDMYYSTKDPSDYVRMDAVIPEKAFSTVPEDLGLVFWDYYETKYEYYNKKLSDLVPFNREIIFGGGVWSWDGFLPNIRFTFDTMKPALNVCLDRDIKFVIATMWGASGTEANFNLCIGGLALFSEYSYLGRDCTDDDVFDVSAALTGDTREFTDAISDLALGYDGAVSAGKGAFYGDILLPTVYYDFDYRVMKDTYKKSLETLSRYKDHKYYDFYSTFFEICHIKAELFLNLRDKYKAGDKEYIKNVTTDVIPELTKLYRRFYEIFKSISFESYKKNGFEIVHIRLGGILMRLEYAAEVLNDYAEGRVSIIDELENEPISGINKTWCSPEQYLSTSF